MAKLDGKKILIAEDDSLLAQMLAKKLGEENGTVEHAADGEAAMGMLKANKYDVLLLDLMLPKVDGFGVLTALPTIDMSKGTPVIVLSNLGQKADVEKGMALGAKKFLIKAILSLDDIADSILEVLK
jgi:DNA-binding response OmpR family regulator